MYNVRKLPNEQQRAEGREYMKKKINQAIMSKRVGNVLGSKPGRLGVKVGNAIIKGFSAPFKWAGRQIEKEMRMNKAKDDEYRRQGEDMMKGREEYKPLKEKKKAEAMLLRGMQGKKK